MVQLTRSATLVTYTATQQQRLRQEFARRHCLCLPNLLAPGLLQQIQGWLERDQFMETAYQGIGTDSVSHQPLVFHTLHLLINDPVFLRFIGEIAGIEQIGRLRGRVYRMLPDTEHEFKMPAPPS